MPEEVGAATLPRHHGGSDGKRARHPLAAFSPRQLIDELRRRGYTGELKYTNIIKL